MPHCPECGLWVHPADPSCLACEADLGGIDARDAEEYDRGEGLMAEEVTRGRLQTEMRMVEFGFAFAYDRGPIQVLYSAGLLAIAWLILPLFALLGYAVSVGQHAAQGRDNIPKMEDITNFMGPGLRVFLSTILSFWLPIVVYLYLIWFYIVETEMVLIGWYEYPIDTNPVSIVFFYGVAILAVLLWPAIATLYTGTLSIADTYRPGQLFTFLRSRFYLKSIAAFLTITLVFAVAIGSLVIVILAIDHFVGIGTGGIGILGGAMSLVPLAGIIFLTAYGLSVLFSALGYNYYHASEAVVVPEAE